MNVMVQHLETHLYRASKDKWVKLDQQPLVFENPVNAVSFCIQHSIRLVRLVSNAGSPGKEIFVYPFGQDPAIKAERKKLRRFLSESKRLKQQKQILMARMDMLYAEAKERKKQIPFKRKRPGAD